MLPREKSTMHFQRCFNDFLLCHATHIHIKKNEDEVNSDVEQELTKNQYHALDVQL